MFVVIDHRGPHDICARLCDCSRLETSRTIVQLLRAGWWPATIEHPETAIDIRTLKQFHALALQGKVNAYDYWLSLQRVASNSGMRDVKVLLQRWTIYFNADTQPQFRYKEFLVVFMSG